MTRPQPKQVQHDTARPAHGPAPDPRRATSAPLPAHVSLHRALGNQGMQRLLQSRTIQPKLRVGQPNEPYQLEADRVADEVMRRPAPEERQATGTSGRGAATKSGTFTQPKFTARDFGSEAAPSVADDFLGSPGRGRPLAADTRAFMEPRFGRDFSGVRVYTGEVAERANCELHSQAFTYGNGIWLGRGHHATPNALLAHELAHVVQQGAAPTLSPGHVTAVPPRVETRSGPHVARQDTIIEVEIISSRDEYQPPGSRETYRVGDAAASRVLMDIQELIVAHKCALDTGTTVAREFL